MEDTLLRSQYLDSYESEPENSYERIKNSSIKAFTLLATNAYNSSECIEYLKNRLEYEEIIIAENQNEPNEPNDPNEYILIFKKIIDIYTQQLPKIIFTKDFDGIDFFKNIYKKAILLLNEEMYEPKFSNKKLCDHNITYAEMNENILYNYSDALIINM